MSRDVGHPIPGIPGSDGNVIRDAVGRHPHRLRPRGGRRHPGHVQLTKTRVSIFFEINISHKRMTKERVRKNFLRKKTAMRNFDAKNVPKKKQNFLYKKNAKRAVGFTAFLGTEIRMRRRRIN